MTTVENTAIGSQENVPLQKGRKTRRLCNCNEDYMGGSNFINVAFGSLTFIITVALLLQIYYGDYQVVPHGSVATDSLECSKIGTSVLKKGGNAVDATIASALCLAVAAPHLTSLDGEGLALIYNHRKRVLPDVIDFSSNTNNGTLLPRLVTGLAYLHQQYGSLAWKTLVEPAANLAKQGFLIPRMLVEAIKQAKAEDLYGHLEAGQLLQLENLSKTLQEIGNIPENELYKYINPGNQPKYSQAIKLTFSGYDIYAPNAPSVGPSFLTNLQQLEKFNFSLSDTSKTEYIYRLAEVTQNLYQDFNITDKFHQGTSTNIATMDLDDTYVSFTTGLYQFFGSSEMTTFGYILDVHNRDRTCTRLPLIITDALAICGRRLALATNDLETASQLTMALLIAKENLITSIEAPRFHILYNGSIGIEGAHTPYFNDDVLKYLETLTTTPLLVSEPYLSCNIVEKVKDNLNSHSDSRGGGISSRF